MAEPNRPRPDRVARRIDAINWRQTASDLDEHGFSVVGKLLSATQCQSLKALYGHDEVFRSRVVMARHGFGRGEYRYLAYPLPPVVQTLREAIYPQLAAIANRWCEVLGKPGAFPAVLGDYLGACRGGGQSRPTPLILKYVPGDYNCLHRDLYGELFFPLQLTVLLSRPGGDFNGGEFMLVENRPRRQSVGRVVHLNQGEGVVFPVHQRPVCGARGFYQVSTRHGVSPVMTGERYALGVIFHDAA